jgi:hypothetical protein
MQVPVVAEPDQLHRADRDALGGVLVVKILRRPGEWQGRQAGTRTVSLELSTQIPPRS